MSGAGGTDGPTGGSPSQAKGPGASTDAPEAGSAGSEEGRRARRPPFRADPVARAAGGSFRAEDRRAEAPESLPEAPTCPFCSGDETELMSAFGSHASVSTYWCRACRSPFELMKWR